MILAAMDSKEIFIWSAILGVSLTTFLTRGSFILLGARVRLPEVVDRALQFAPACALAAILVPDLVLVHGTLKVAGNPRLLAAVVAAVCFLVSRSMILTIVCGMAAFTAIRLWW
jgi:branched-subunit amino acid transport protein